MYFFQYLLRLLIGIGTDAIRIAVLLSPKAFYNATVDLGIMSDLDSVSRCFLRREFNKSIALVLENSDILNIAIRRESFFYQIVRYSICKASAVYGAVCRTALVVNLKKHKISL